jgi:hypothetical protein
MFTRTVSSVTEFVIKAHSNNYIKVGPYWTNSRKFYSNTV